MIREAPEVSRAIGSREQPAAMRRFHRDRSSIPVKAERQVGAYKGLANGPVARLAFYGVASIRQAARLPLFWKRGRSCGGRYGDVRRGEAVAVNKVESGQAYQCLDETRLYQCNVD